MATTTGRSRHRQGVHAGAQGAAGEHSSKIMVVLGTATVVIVLVLTFTKIGHVIDAATQHFMLYYAGVFALIGLTGSVLLGLVATDRIVMTPGHRVMAQAVHRAFAFGTLAFLIIHIVTEILAQRAHVIDGVIPFLSPFRTFYIGLGTIASDLIVLLVMTSIIRKRFTGHGKAWRWRAIHYTSYVAFVFGVLHGLLGGRAAKPYVDWSYGFAIAAAALGVVIRFLAISLRPKEALSAPPGADRPAASRPSPMRAAGLSMAQAQLAGTLQVLPATASARTTAPGMPGTDSWSPPASTGPIPAISAQVSTVSGPFPAVPGPAPMVSGPFPAVGAASAYAAESSAAAYRELGFTPLGAPPYGDDAPTGHRVRPYAGGSPTPPRQALAGPPRAGRQETGRAARQPRYEPGYDGPPRFEGAPRRDMPQDQPPSYPYDPPGSQSDASGSGATPALPGPGSGPAPGGRPRRGDLPGTDPITGPFPRAGTGPFPRAGTGPMPWIGNGQLPPAGTGPVPRAGTGPMPQAGAGPVPRAGAGSMPRTAPQPPVGAPEGARTDRGRRGTGRPARAAGPTDRRRREGPGPSRGDVR